MPVDENSVST